MAEIFEIKPLFAKKNDIPVIFAASILKETEKAVYLYGHGTMETRKTGKCCVCGRTLTHPVSVILGIGPECGKHAWDYDIVGGYDEAQKAVIEDKLKELSVDQWLPKSVIKQKITAETDVQIPADHKIFQKKEDNMVKKKTASQVQYQNGNAAIKIMFPFDRDTLENVKSLPGRKFHSKENPKYWSCPLIIQNVEKLVQFGFELDEKLQKFHKFKNQPAEKAPTKIDIPGLKGKLFPYQEEGVAFVEAKNGKALIADEMGLGKTIQALAYLQLHPELRPALVLCPALLKHKWAREMVNWLSNPGQIQILEGRTEFEPITGDIVICNYDIFANKYVTKTNADGKKKKVEQPGTGWVDMLIKKGIKVVIADEAHYYKNNDAARTKSVRKFSKHVEHFIALTGTPINNRPVEIFNPVHFIDNTVFPNFMTFGKKYCAGHHNGFGWDFSGASNISELHNILTSTVMIRRKKKDVLKQLPDKTYSYVPFDIDNRDEYNAAMSDFLGYIKTNFGAAIANKKAGAEVLTKITALKQLAGKGKRKKVIEWINNFLESGDEKLVVFGEYKETLRSIAEEFPGISLVLNGDTKDKNEVIRQFQEEDSKRLICVNMKAGGIGVELTASYNVAVVELPWEPGTLDQAIDRTHRIGQMHGVMVNYLLAYATFEEKLAKLIDKKRTINDQAMDGIETDEEYLIGELIDSMLETA